MRIRETALGKDHPDTATTYHNIGTVYFAQGDFREAVTLLEKALAIVKKVLGAEHPLTQSTQSWLDAARERMTQKETL